MDNVAINQQVPPVSNDLPSIHDLVIQDLEERKEFGKGKYNTILQAFNGRKPLVDAYQEILDLAVYVKQKLEEGNKERTELLLLANWLLTKNYLTTEGHSILVNRLENYGDTNYSEPTPQENRCVRQRIGRINRCIG